MIRSKTSLLEGPGAFLCAEFALVQGCKRWEWEEHGNGGLTRLQDPSGQALISLLINALGKDMSLAQD